MRGSNGEDKGGDRKDSDENPGARSARRPEMGGGSLRAFRQAWFALWCVEASWAPLWSLLGASGVPPGASWRLMGASWKPLGGLLEASWGVLGRLGRLKTPPRSPRRRPGRPRRRPGRPRRRPRGPKRRPRGPKRRPRGPQEAPKRPTRGPKRPLEAPKSPQDAPKRRPRSTQDGSESLLKPNGRTP